MYGSWGYEFYDYWFICICIQPGYGDGIPCCSLASSILFNVSLRGGGRKKRVWQFK